MSLYRGVSEGKVIFNLSSDTLESRASIIRLMSRLGALAACMFAIIIPTTYYYYTTMELRHTLTLETAFLAKSIEKIVQARPDMWEFESARLMELTSQPSLHGEQDERIIFTAAGTIVIKSDFATPRPYIMVSVTVFDSGTPAGSIVAKRSIRTPLITAVLLGILSSLFGYFIYFVFRTYPIKILYNTFTELHNEKEKTEKILQAIGDGVISVDSGGKIQFINHAAESLIERKASESVGRTLDEVYTLRQMGNKDGENGNLNILVGKEGNEYIIEEIRTSMQEMEKGKRGTVIIIRDISGRNDAEEIRRNYELSIAQMRKVLGATVNAIVAMVEIKDPYTAGHQRRVADLARTIATAMGLEADKIEGIRVGATIHDIGKICVPAEILSKPAKLKGTEFEIIKDHSRAGYEILRDIDFPWPISRMVLEHHERIDGSGYPDGLTGFQTLIESKIIAVADVIEAIASHRPYRPALGINMALAEIVANKGTLYDPVVVDTCLRLFNEKSYNM